MAKAKFRTHRAKSVVQICRTKTLKCLMFLATGLCPRKATQRGWLFWGQGHWKGDIFSVDI